MLILILFIVLKLVSLNCSPVPICSTNLKLSDSKFCGKYYECVKLNGEWKLKERYCENDFIFDQATGECKVGDELSNKCSPKLNVVRSNQISKQNRKLKNKTKIPIKLSKNWIAIYIKGCDEDELDEATEEFEEISDKNQKKENLNETENSKDDKSNCNKVLIDENKPSQILPTIKPDKAIKNVLDKNVNLNLKPTSKDKPTSKSNKTNKLNEDEINWNSNIVIRKRKPNLPKTASSTPKY